MRVLLLSTCSRLAGRRDVTPSRYPGIGVGRRWIWAGVFLGSKYPRRFVAAQAEEWKGMSGY